MKISSLVMSGLAGASAFNPMMLMMMSGGFGGQQQAAPAASTGGSMDFMTCFLLLDEPMLCMMMSGGFGGQQQVAAPEPTYTAPASTVVYDQPQSFVQPTYTSVSSQWQPTASYVDSYTQTAVQQPTYTTVQPGVYSPPAATTQWTTSTQQWGVQPTVQYAQQGFVQSGYPQYSQGYATLQPTQGGFAQYPQQSGLYHSGYGANALFAQSNVAQPLYRSNARDAPKDYFASLAQTLVAKKQAEKLPEYMANWKGSVHGIFTRGD